MERNFEKAFKKTLVHEGGWSDDPNDPGGATMKGVTLETYSNFLGRPATRAELRNIPDGHLQAIYRTGYWDKVKASDLPSGVDFAVYDAAVNSGPARAAKWLQSALGVPADGVIGPKTLAAAKAADPAAMIERIMDLRLAFLKNLATWKHFGKGWSSRVASVRAEALEMVEHVVIAPRLSIIDQIKALIYRLFGV